MSCYYSCFYPSLFPFIHSGSTDLKHGKTKNMLAQDLVPFCMDGAKHAACSCRIPGKEEDEIKAYPTKDIRHFVIFRYMCV